MTSFGVQQVPLQLSIGRPRNSLDFLAKYAYYRFHGQYPTYQGELCL
jgi:hypothetical protein